jgi:hypothetical protein
LEGYQVLQFHAKDRVEAELLYNLTDTHLLDIWNDYVHIDAPTDIMFSPSQVNLAKTVGLPFEVLVSDVQQFFDESSKEREALKLNASLDFYDQFPTLPQIQAYMQNLATANPTLTTPISAGSSLQGRGITGLRLTQNNGQPKRVVVFNGGQHAREWISPVTTIYMMEQLLLPANRQLLETVEYHIFPVMNPDGYLHSWTNGNRNHRKNMRTNSGSTCIGVDNNRNWNSNWNRGGSSTNPCADNFMGPSAFSEPEDRLIGDYLRRFPNGFCYMDIHAYGLMWMTPYGWSSTLPANYQAQLALSNNCAAAIRSVAGSQFRTGNVFNVIYQASGASNDFAYDVAGFTHSFAIELRGTSFNPPVSNIRLSGQEMWAALQVIARAAAEEK